MEENVATPSAPASTTASAGGAPAYAVKLPVFEGPLDLLLHLIKLNEVEITDIPVARIARQYVDYLELMRELNLDVAGEYLVMAATLAWIKSRMLLPPEGEEESEEGPDPRAELVARLLEYQRFKEAAGQLAERPRLGRDVFAPQPPAAPRREAGEREIEVGLLELLEAFRRVLKQTRHSGHAHELEVETVSVRDRMLAVMKALESADSVEFLSLFREAGGGVASRSVVVATFLAILELARLAAVRIFQGLGADGAPEGPIRLRGVGDDVTWQERVAEIM